MTSGTMNDKVSALTLAIQESPVHNIRAFEALLNLASKKSRSQAIIALAAIVDLMGPGLLLPTNRKLFPFNRQPGLMGALQNELVSAWNPSMRLPGAVTPRHLISWVFEDWLKSAYFKVVQLLEVWSSDDIDYSRTRSLDFIFGLLREKPEQEANLLRLLVNKLGDRDRKLASRSSHLLLQLENIHPKMKDIIIRTIEHEVILRPGQSIKARYYAVNTLNQTILSTKEAKLSENLLSIYFAMFSTMLTSGEMGSLGSDSSGSATLLPLHGVKTQNSEALTEKLISAILTGINRAIPFLEGSENETS